MSNVCFYNLIESSGLERRRSGDSKSSGLERKLSPPHANNQRFCFLLNTKGLHSLSKKFPSLYKACMSHSLNSFSDIHSHAIEQNRENGKG
jgi:hypothetical protein